MPHSHSPAFDPSRVKAISIDLDDTLWPIAPTMVVAEQVLLDWFDEHAPPAAELARSPTAVRAARAHAMRTQAHALHDLGLLRLEAIRELLRQADQDPAQAEVAFAVFHQARLRVTLFDDVLPALTFLSERYPVVGLSNGTADLGHIGLSPYFHASLNARGLGLAKPDVRTFQAAAQAAQVSPDAVLHVGDDVHHDIAGALAAGMQAAWVERGGRAWDDVGADVGGRPHLVVNDLRQLCLLLADSGAPVTGRSVRR